MPFFDVTGEPRLGEYQPVGMLTLPLAHHVRKVGDRHPKDEQPPNAPIAFLFTAEITPASTTIVTSDNLWATITSRAWAAL